MKTAILATLFLSLPAHAFRSADVESFTDPDFSDYRPQKVDSP